MTNAWNVAQQIYNKKYDPDKENKPQTLESIEEPEKKSIEEQPNVSPWEQAQTLYQKEQEKPYSPWDEDIEIDKDIERHIARLTSRGIEQVVGAPGNIRDLAYWAKDYLKDKEIIPGLKKPKEPESFKNIEQILPIAETVSNLLNYLPTSSQLKEKSEKLTLGYTKPESELEKTGDEVFERLVSSALPGQGQRNIWRNIAAPVIGILGKEAVKYVGGGKDSQAMTDLGLTLATTLMGGSAPRLNRDAWNTTRQLASRVQQPVNVTQARQEMQTLRNQLATTRLGDSDANAVIRVADTFLDNTANGTMTAQQLMGFNESLNAIRGDPATLRGARNLLNQVGQITRRAGNQFEQVAPEFYQNWTRANEIHGAIQASNYVQRIVNAASNKIRHDATRSLFGLAAHGAMGAAKALPPIFLVGKGTQVLHRMARSPELMRYYTGIMTNALRGNIAAAADDLNKLDEGLAKEDKKHPIFKD